MSNKHVQVVDFSGTGLLKKIDGTNVFGDLTLEPVVVQQGFNTLKLLKAGAPIAEYDFQADIDTQCAEIESIRKLEGCPKGAISLGLNLMLMNTGISVVRSQTYSASDIPDFWVKLRPISDPDIVKFRIESKELTSPESKEHKHRYWVISVSADKLLKTIQDAPKWTLVRYCE